MDKLETLQRFERSGGEDRRKKLGQLILFTRKAGCSVSTASGKVAGVRLKFGTLQFTLLGVDENGSIRIFANPCEGITGGEAVHENVNAYVKESEALTPATMPILHHSTVAENFDDVPLETLTDLVTNTIAAIRLHVYGEHKPVTPIGDAFGAGA
jgi:hypothetical protein